MPRIRARNVTKVSRWVDIIAREVEFVPGEPPQLYHALGQQDYLAIVALTPDGRIPIVRQYRPAVEGFTWELPAGLVEPGEDPAVGCARELQEETGFSATRIVPLGEAMSCSARLSNRIHSFFVETGERTAGFEPERGITVALRSPSDLAAMIEAGEFAHQLHLGALLLAQLRGLLVLDVRR
jgi:8-oxo-dGTP pyrophosphatase MutT (NUDIX family)